MIPYVTMASVPIDLRNNPSTRPTRITYSVNAMAGFSPGLRMYLDLIRDRHWMTLIMNLALTITTPVLTPLKSGLLQATKDSEVCTVTASIAIGCSLIALYSLMIAGILGMIIRLWERPTGLKWDPATLSAQMALLHKSNMTKAFNGLDFYNWAQLRHAMRDLGPEYGIFRLGYWQNKENPSDIIQCV
jgi:hypothetical protein